MRSSEVYTAISMLLMVLMLKSEDVAVWEALVAIEKEEGGGLGSCRPKPPPSTSEAFRIVATSRLQTPFT